MAAEPSTSLKGKLLDYFGSVWNQFDFAIYLLCVVTFVLKHFKQTFWVKQLKEKPSNNYVIELRHCGTSYGTFTISWLIEFGPLLVATFLKWATWF